MTYPKHRRSQSTGPAANSLTPTVFIVDDDPQLVKSLLVLVGSVGHRARGYASAGEFLEDFDPERSGCVLLDERMPGMSGHALHEELLRRGCAIPIVVYTGHANVQTVVAAMKRGAVTVLEKPCRDDEMLDAIEEALRRDAATRERVTRKRALALRLASLSRRQHEVMALLIRGKPTKMIAIELGISLRTVELHRAHVLEAMGVGSIAELADLLARSDADD